MIIKVLLLALITASSVFCKSGELLGQPGINWSRETREVLPYGPLPENYAPGGAESRFEMTITADDA